MELKCEKCKKEINIFEEEATFRANMCFCEECYDEIGDYSDVVLGFLSKQDFKFAK